MFKSRVAFLVALVLILGGSIGINDICQAQSLQISPAPAPGRPMIAPMPGRPMPGIRPMPGGPAAAKPASNKAWSQASCVFIGKLKTVTAGPTAMSMPPIHSTRLDFEIEKVLRGDLKPGDTMTANHSARQNNRPTFPEGKTCAVAVNFERGNWIAIDVKEASDALIKKLELITALPLGWKQVGDGVVSPWSHFGDKGWPAKYRRTTGLFDAKTGRPALMAGAALLEIEPVPPVESIKWTNPDGDGLYKVTVSNPTDQPIKVSALLTDGDNILWNESLLILCQDKYYTIPGCKGVTSENVRPVTLAPGEKVSTEINAFLLEGPNWPQGGYRIKFEFTLGEKSEVASFYYMTRHHEKIRLDGLKKFKE